MAYNFVNPGSAVASAMEEILAERKAAERQAMLDQIMQQREARADEVQRGQLELNAESVRSLVQRREANEKSGALDAALKRANTMTPGQDISGTGIGEEFTAAGVPNLATKKTTPASTIPVPKAQEPTDDASGVLPSTSQAGVITPEKTTEQFIGLPAQIKAQEDKARLDEFINDPNTPEPIRNYLAAQRAATDKDLPPQLFGFGGPQGSAGIQEYNFYVNQERAAGREPVTFDAYQERDANRRRTVNTNAPTDSGYTPKQIITFNQLRGSMERSPLVKAADRTIILDKAVQDIKADPAAPASQLNLAYAYIQGLDTYQSAVREGELGNLGVLGTMWENLGVQMKRVLPKEMGGEGAFLPPNVALQIADSAERMSQTIRQGAENKKREYGEAARVSNIGPMWQDYMGGVGTTSTAPPLGGAPPPGPGGAPPAPGAQPPPAPTTAPIRWGRDAQGNPVRIQ